MSRKKHYRQLIFGLINGVIIISSFTSINAQTNYKKNGESKIWQTRQIDVLRSHYQDAKGIPSHKIFMQNHGIYPYNQKIEIIPYFVVSFLLEDIERSGGKEKPRKSAKPLNPDFFIEKSTKYDAPNIAETIWDGRVYEEGNNLIVGGYSSEYNERPIANFDDRGKFVVTVDESISDKFPLLRLQGEQIVFDPFHWQLLRVVPDNEEQVVEIQRSYLPIKLFDIKGVSQDDVYYFLQYSPANSLLILNARFDDKIIEIAKSDIMADIIVDKREGYQPELIKGCIQPASGKVISFSFRGNFSKNIRVCDDMLQIELPEDPASRTIDDDIKNIKIDGEFADWRNIAGTGDPKGDRVSYLYPNPDTDILEFKVANDDNYLYLYSRVTGAHGRTGPEGRYYWYAYIDVDADPNTGYPPTRDDNCYFGVAIGDDCEAQFEFVANRFVKTFFGFTGIGAEKEALDGQVKLGPSFYSPQDPNGRKRDRYKIEYVNREGTRYITHDYTEGTSEDIIMALSPDGSEVEMRVEYKGFLRDRSGHQLMYPGRIIDIAVGAEAESDYYGTNTWGADSSPVLYRYEIK